jgi:hypothetical protein
MSIVKSELEKCVTVDNLNWNKYILFLQTVEKSDIDLLSISAG